MSLSDEVSSDPELESFLLAIFVKFGLTADVATFGLVVSSSEALSEDDSELLLDFAFARCAFDAKKQICNQEK